METDEAIGTAENTQKDSRHGRISYNLGWCVRALRTLQAGVRDALSCTRR